MKKVVVAAACLLGAFSIAFAQPSLPRQVSVWKPADLDKNIVSESKANAVLESPYGQKGKTKNYWVVFSDRAENPVYSAPGGNTRCGTLDFGEKLRIAKLENGYALVYVDPMTDYPKISQHAESKGWIPLSNLLLWNRALSDEVGISHKAVVCVNLDNARDVKTSTIGKRYKSPSGLAPENLESGMHFYYVLKKEGKKVLLGGNALIDTAVDLLGWVDEGAFVPWDSRTCLEPTWEKKDVEYFARKLVQWEFFPSRKMTGTAPIGEVFRTDKKPGVDPLPPAYKQEYKYRYMPPSFLRYPLLAGGDKDTYYCAPFRRLGEKVMTAEKMARIDEAKNKASIVFEERKKVNVVVVIDGTYSMEPYFKSVIQVLNDIDKFFSDTKGAKINVGVTIYRDKEDGKYLTECFPEAEGGFVDPKNQNLRKWLESGGKYGIKSVASGYTESVFYGINTALDHFFPQTKNMKVQSNIMLVIGDCGDNGKMKVSRETLIQKLADQNVTLMGFQVTNKKQPDYSLFTEQLCDIMKRSVQTRYDRDNFTSDGQKMKVGVKELDNHRGWEVNSQSDQNIYVGIYRYNPQLNKPILTEDLTLMVQESMNVWKTSLQVVSDMMSRMINYPDQIADKDDYNKDATVALLNGYGMDGERIYKDLLEADAIISFRGYGYKTRDTRPLFKVVVFLPENELKELFKKLEGVYDAAQNENLTDRYGYYEAMMSLAKTVVSQKEIKTESYYSILAKVFGISDYKPADGFTLEDIVDPSIVNPDMYQKIIHDMSDSMDQLRTVTSSNYPFTYKTTSGEKYYWLPSEYLPLP